MPKSWIDDSDRREEAHIPEDTLFRTKWEIAADQVEECIGDETYRLFCIVSVDRTDVAGGKCVGRATSAWPLR